MNNLALQRIKAQIKLREISNPQPSASPPQELSEPIPIDELRTIFCNLYQSEPSAVPNIKIHFENVYDFCPWYLRNQEQFSEPQRAALNSLVQVFNAIGVGCACRRKQREVMAHEYFVKFWQNNKETDLIPTVAKIAQAVQVSFGDFYTYSRPTP